MTLKSPSVQPDTRFHVAEGEGDVVHSKFEVTDPFLLDEQGFLFQAEQATESDAAQEPDLDPMAEGQVHLSRKDLYGHAAAQQPAGVTVARSFGVEVEFALETHGIQEQPLCYKG